MHARPMQPDSRPPAGGSTPGAIRTLVVLPTYNERGNLRQLIPRLLEVDAGLGVVVVDDASPDGTGKVAEELHRELPARVRVIHRPAKLGLGTAYLAGFRFGLELGARRIVTMDADLSHHPRHLPALLEASGRGYDLVIGSRYVPGGATPDFPLHRRLLSRTANLVAHAVAGLAARDATSGYRCYRSATLAALPLDSIRSDGYSFLVELLFLVQSSGARIAEVPISFEDRAHGVSKISRSEIGKAVVTVLRLARRRLRGPPGRDSASEAEASRDAG